MMPQGVEHTFWSSEKVAASKPGAVMPQGDPCRVLVIGKGGREHALAWRLKQSPRAAKVFCAPGNAGTARDGITNVPIDHYETDKLQRFCAKEKIGLVVIGPEDPLAAGLADYLRGKGYKVFGPSKDAARIEGSKVFAKELMQRADVPTAEFRVFDHPQPARDYIGTTTG
jgi:phosphoribosylamine---glycine ligase